MGERLQYVQHILTYGYVNVPTNVEYDSVIEKGKSEFMRFQSIDDREFSIGPASPRSCS